MSMARQQAIVDLFRRLFLIPNDYQVLFLAGGARHQYEQLLLNYAHKFQFKLLSQAIGLGHGQILLIVQCLADNRADTVFI